MKKISIKNITKKLLILFAAIGFIFSIDYFSDVKEASAVVCEVSHCPCGKVYKKSAAMWSPGAVQDTVGSCVWPWQV
ncbi:hypothetical protein ACNMZ4_09825 [Aerococcus urinaeequi]|uniref:hypothetical protein n=1 Tax=Aerococcus urinaeequi TaxID=51665 RepID=UPI003AACE428